MILHTNDIHDHVRAGYEQVGGLPYVAGFIAAVRQEEKGNVLVLDAGDVTEKGDMVAARSHGLLTYEAMRRIGYDAIAIGNHDNDAGIAWLRRYDAAVGGLLVCLNRMKPDGTPEFAESKVFRVGALKIGVIGMIVPQDEGTLDFLQSARALERAAADLKTRVDVVIALCHEGSLACKAWSQLAPTVDLFVSGHSHEALPRCLVVPATGARIVQAGCYARYVGHLEIIVDLEKKRITEARENLMLMKHDSIPIDRALDSWINGQEQKLCPGARRVVFENHETMTASEIAWLAAAALRQAAAVDIAFCHGGQVVRDTLPLGPVDVNAVFLTGGQRGENVVRLDLTGAEIGGYLAALAQTESDPTNWAGFRAVYSRSKGKPELLSTSLDANRTYSVVMPRVEWETRFLRMVKRVNQRQLGGPLAGREFSCVPAAVNFLDALLGYLEPLARERTSLKAEAARLVEEATETLAESSAGTPASRPEAQDPVGAIRSASRSLRTAAPGFIPQPR